MDDKTATAYLKVCTYCHTQKPINEFSFNVRGKDGHRDQCKACTRLYYEAHLSERRSYAQEYYAERKKQKQEYERAYYQTHREQKAAYTKRYYEANKESAKVRAKRCYAQRRDSDKWKLIHKKYGLTKAAYQDLLDSQGGVCAICGKPETRENKNLYVDHDHVTGRVRALLCDGCNTALGMVEENTETIQAMLKYLEAHRG